MKKWMYLISVGAMLAVFTFFYLASEKEVAAREAKHKADIVAQAKVDSDRKALLDSKAREDADKRASDRLADEKRKEDEKVAKQAAEDKKVKDAFDKYTAEADRLSKKANQLELELGAFRSAKEKISREAFDLAKRVEASKVARRTAELNIQRTTEMVARRAAESSMVRPPVVAAPVAPPAS